MIMCARTSNSNCEMFLSSRALREVKPCIKTADLVISRSLARSMGMDTMQAGEVEQHG